MMAAGKDATHLILHCRGALTLEDLSSPWKANSHTVHAELLPRNLSGQQLVEESRVRKGTKSGESCNASGKYNVRT